MNVSKPKRMYYEKERCILVPFASRRGDSFGTTTTAWHSWGCTRGTAAAAETPSYSGEQWQHLPKPALPNVASVVPNDPVEIGTKTLRMASVLPGRRPQCLLKNGENTRELAEYH